MDQQEQIAFSIYEAIGNSTWTAAMTRKSCPVDENVLITGKQMSGRDKNDFEADTSLESIINVFGLTSSDPLHRFAEMWYQVFLWALFTSIFAHVVAALIAFCRLRKHRYGRWIPVLILAMGVLSPLTGGTVTSAAIAGFYRGSGFSMKPFYALCWGTAQTMGVIFVSFTRVLSTL